MNNTFSLHRVALYARKHYVENGRNYLYGFLTLAALSIIILYILPYKETNILIILLLILPVYFTQLACRSHYDRRSIERSYTLPVTSSEKFLFIWFNSAILTTIISFAIVFFISFLFTTIQGKPTGLCGEEIRPILIESILIFQALALLSCCWVKGSPLKGYLIFAVVFIAGIYLHSRLNILLSDASHSIDVLNSICSLRSDTAGITYRLNDCFSDRISTYFLLGFWTVVAWATAYFKFKERTLK